MRKFVYVCLAMLVLSSVSAVATTYTYSLSGKVYQSGTTIPVSTAAVTLTIHWSTGATSGGTITQNDGSFSFSLWGGTTDYKGVKMTLKATKGSPYRAGSTTWWCNGYSETKDVYIALSPNPGWAFDSSGGHYVGPSTIVMPAVAYLDDGSSATLTVLDAQLSYDPAAMTCTEVYPAPGLGAGFTYTISAAGDITVHAEAAALVPIGDPDNPTPLFLLQWNIPETSPAVFTSVVGKETTELITSVGTVHTVLNHTDFLLGELDKCKGQFFIETKEQWEEALYGERPAPNIRPVSEARWKQYMEQWNDTANEFEGLHYPDTTFVPATGQIGLYVWGGGDGVPAGDEGLVMAWQHDNTQSGDYASAWEWDYGLDPDLTNCIIQVTVTPPKPPVGIASSINRVSFSIVDAAGLMRTWWWGVPNPIPLGVSTTVKINTAIQGINAATPVATGYMNAAGFNLKNSQFFDVDENFNYIFGQEPVPPPGQPTYVWAWNYWHNLLVTKNTSAYKGTWTKYSQPPVVIDPNDPPKINGWDERSIYDSQQRPVMADDWFCTDDRPVTDIHWWGSFLGWTQPFPPRPPLVVPRAFHIGIWTDVPKDDPQNEFPFSHPGTLIWENYCTTSVWNFAGYDVDPRPDPDPLFENEACFQFNQLLSEDEYFAQDPNENNIYWLSIAAIYNPDDIVQYPWGWKTRPHIFQDDAVRTTDVIDASGASVWPPTLGAIWNAGVPVQVPEYPDPTGKTWDLAFELTTNVRPPCHELEADLNHDCKVDILDFAEFAAQWLETSP